MRPWLLLLLLFLPVTVLLAQADSLRRELTNKNDSLRADACLQLGKLYFVQFNNGDSLINYSRQGLSIAEKTGNHTQLYQAKKQIAGGYVRNGDSANAVTSLRAAMEEAIDSGDSTHIADVYHLYAGLYGNLGHTDSALAFLVREVETASAVHYYNATAAAYSGIAWIYRGRNQFDRMLFYHRKALELVSLMEKTNLGNIIQVYAVASQGYMMSAQHYKDDRQMDTAKILADTVMAMAVRLSRLSPQASANFVYASHALYYRQYENAERFALKGLELRNYIDHNTQILFYTILAVSNANLQNGTLALQYLDSARLSPAMTQLYYRNHHAETSWQVYALLGNYEAALRAHELYMATKDTLDNIVATRAINEIEQKFHKGENEREIQRLAAEQKIASLNNRLLTAGVGAAVLLALIIFLVYRQRNLKNEQERLLTEQRLNRARMDPHFLFNTFTALQGMVLKEKDPVKAANYLSEYAVIMRQTLESTYNDLITLEEEISYLEKYLSLQQMRMPGKFDYSISVDNKIDPSEQLIPAMIIQPFTENSIEHAFSDIDYTGQLDILFSADNGELKITIKDNGQGFHGSKADKSYPSRATGIIRDRLSLLNKKHHSNARCTVETNSGGVAVTIFLPNLT